MSGELPEVGGDRLPCSLVEFEHRCKTWLREEQRKCSPDNARIALICDAVRLSRENAALATKPIRGSAYREGVIVGAQGAKEQTARKCAEIAANYVDWDASIAVHATASGIASAIYEEFGLCE